MRLCSRVGSELLRISVKYTLTGDIGVCIGIKAIDGEEAPNFYYPDQQFWVQTREEYGKNMLIAMIKKDPTKPFGKFTIAATVTQISYNTTNWPEDCAIGSIFETMEL